MTTYTDYTPPTWLDVLYLVVICWVHFYYLVKITNLSLKHLYFNKICDSQSTNTYIIIKSLGFNTPLSLTTQQKLTLYHLTPLLNECHKNKIYHGNSNGIKNETKRQPSESQNFQNKNEEKENNNGTSNISNPNGNNSNNNNNIAKAAITGDKNNNNNNNVNRYRYPRLDDCCFICCTQMKKWIDSRQILTLTWHKMDGIRLLLKLIVFISICCSISIWLAVLGNIFFEFLVTSFVNYENASYLALLILIPLLFVIVMILRISWQSLLLSWSMEPDIIAYRLNKEYRAAKIQSRHALCSNDFNAMAYSSGNEAGIAEVNAETIDVYERMDDDDGMHNNRNEYETRQTRQRRQRQDSDDNEDDDDYMDDVNNNLLSRDSRDHDNGNRNVGHNASAIRKHDSSEASDENEIDNDNEKPGFYSRRSIVGALGGSSKHKHKNKNEFGMKPMATTAAATTTTKYEYNRKSSANTNIFNDLNAAKLALDKQPSLNPSETDLTLKRELTITASTITALSDQNSNNTNNNNNNNNRRSDNENENDIETDTDILIQKENEDNKSDMLSQSDINVEYQAGVGLMSPNDNNNHDGNDNNNNFTNFQKKRKKRHKFKSKHHKKHRKHESTTALVAGDLMVASPLKDLPIVNLTTPFKNVQQQQEQQQGQGSSKPQSLLTVNGNGQNTRDDARRFDNNNEKVQQNVSSNERIHQLLDDWLTQKDFDQLMDIVQLMTCYYSPYFMAARWRLSFFVFSLLWGIFAAIDLGSESAFQDTIFVQLILRYLTMGSFCWTIIYWLFVCTFSLYSRLLTWRIFHTKYNKRRARKEKRKHDNKIYDQNKVNDATPQETANNDNDGDGYCSPLKQCINWIYNCFNKSVRACTNYDIWKLFCIVDVYGIPESSNRWRFFKMVIVFAIIVTCIITLLYGLSANNTFVEFIGLVLLLYYFGNIILSSKPRGLYHLIKDANIPALTDMETNRRTTDRFGIATAKLFGKHPLLESSRFVELELIPENETVNVNGTQIYSSNRDVSKENTSKKDNNNNNNNNNNNSNINNGIAFRFDKFGKEKSGRSMDSTCNNSSLAMADGNNYNNRNDNHTLIIETKHSDSDSDENDNDNDNGKGNDNGAEYSASGLSRSMSHTDDNFDKTHGIALKLVDDNKNNNDNNNLNGMIHREGTNTYNVPDPIMPSQSARDHERIMNTFAPASSLSGVLSPISNFRQRNASAASSSESSIIGDSTLYNGKQNNDENEKSNAIVNNQNDNNLENAMPVARVAPIAPRITLNGNDGAAATTTGARSINNGTSPEKKYNITVSDATGKNIVDARGISPATTNMNKNSDAITFDKATVVRQQFKSRRAQMNGVLINDREKQKYLNTLNIQIRNQRDKMQNTKYIYRSIEFNSVPHCLCQMFSMEMIVYWHSIIHSIQTFLANYACYWCVVLPYEDKVVGVSMLVGNASCAKHCVEYKWDCENGKCIKNKEKCALNFHRYFGDCFSFLCDNLCDCCLLFISIVLITGVVYLGVLLSNLSSTTSYTQSDYSHNSTFYAQYPICNEKWEGDLNVLDLIVLAEMSYEMNALESADYTFEQVLIHNYFNNSNNSDNGWQLIYYQLEEPYFFHIKLTNSKIINNKNTQEIHVVSVRGTSSLDGVLQDLSLWFEIVILQTISFVFPIIDAMPISFIREIVYYSSKIEGFINEKLRDRFDEPIYEYITKNIYNESDTSFCDNSDKRLYIVGHSLGGGISQIVGARLKENGCDNVRTFGLSAPGTLYSSQKFGYDVTALDSTFTVLLPRYDIVGKIDKQGGFVQHMDCQQGSFILCHLVNTNLCALRDSCDVTQSVHPNMIETFCDTDSDWFYEILPL